MMLYPKNVNWYCNGCDILCSLLTDGRLNPNKDFICKKGKPNWKNEDEIQEKLKVKNEK